jgi:hypothetical protein
MQDADVGETPVLENGKQALDFSALISALIVNIGNMQSR